MAKTYALFAYNPENGDRKLFKVKGGTASLPSLMQYDGSSYNHLMELDVNTDDMDHYQAKRQYVREAKRLAAKHCNCAPDDFETIEQ